MNTPHILRKALAAVAMLAAMTLTAFGITLEGTFNGTTRYVSKSGSDSNGGTSWEDAKLTIQAAVNLCADGDTVIVDDGEYSDTTSWSTTDSGTTYTIPTVVQITKRIHLVSRNGKHKTHIVGQWANTSTGVANDGTAHRCIFIGASVGNVLIEGFTIRDGSVAATTAGNKSYDCGAGVYGNTGSGQTYLLDCDVVNCRAGTGAAAARKVVPIRCAFVGNCGQSGGHVFYRTDYAYDCVFANNGPASRSGSVFPPVQGTRVVNCTFIDNTCNGFSANDNNSARTHRAWNCAFLGANEFGGVAGGNMYFTNCVQTTTGGRIAEEGSAAGDAVGVSEIQYFYAADSDELKFLSGGNMKDAGTDNALTIAATFVPKEYLDTDFFGNPRKVGDHIDIGAIEAQGAAVAAPASGYIRLSTNVAICAGEKIVSLPRGLVAVESGLAQARLVPALSPATPFFGFAVSGAWDSFFRYPDLGEDRGAWMTPPASGELVTVNIKTATEEKWVDASYAGGDSDGSEAKPYTAIQDAVDNIAAYGLVHVAEGTYATGGVTLSGHSVVSRVGIDKDIAIRASGDPAATIIEGGENTRCVAVRRQAVAAHIQGFTLQGGIADADSSDAGGLGGGFYATPQTWGDTTGLALTYQRNAQVTDCIFTGNVARQGSAICGGWAQRCVFVGNAATDTNRGSTYDTQRGAVAFKSVLSACRVGENPQTRADTVSSLYHCHPYNVTFSEPNRISGSTSSYRPVDRNTPAYNCAFMGGYLDAHNTSVTIDPVGNVGDTTLGDYPWISRYARGELFFDPGSGDLHLRAATDASTKGDASAYRAAMFAVGDLEGNALAYVDGNPVPGAYSTLIGGREIYVDAVNGDDANDGFSSASAKKTIAAALALAYTGDVVHAAPGDYNEGSETYAGGTVISAPNGGAHSPSRGVVKVGVTLVSDEGPDVTFISGVVGNSNGLGDNAVRCLTALGGSTVRGFTLRNGGTFNTTGAARDENLGGLALAPSCRHGLTGTAVFEDCVLSNGWGRTAGCVAGGILRHCKVFSGHATSGATLSMYSRFENCLLVNGASGNTGVRYCGGMLSTTYISERGAGSGANAELNDSLYEYGASYENSVIVTVNSTGNESEAVTMKNVTNCLWVIGGGNATIDSATSANVITVATVADALAMLDADFRPLAGSALVDAGDKTLLAHLTDGATTDVVGGQRIYGGQVDIGAYEYDLRDDIADILGSRVAVSGAGEDVLVSGGLVRIPDGEVVTTITVAEATTLLVPVEVTGTGTLSIYVAGELWQTLTSADGAQGLRLSLSSGDTGVVFAYAAGASDIGAATIGHISGANPFILTFR